MKTIQTNKVDEDSQMIVIKTQNKAYTHIWVNGVCVFFKNNGKDVEITTFHPVERLLVGHSKETEISSRRYDGE